MRRSLACFAAALACLAWLSALPAGADDEAELAAWRQQLDAAQAAVVSAQERAETALAAYQHMRRDRSARGEEKAKIIAERESSERAVEQAQAQLAEVAEQARRAGVPQAWLPPDPEPEAEEDF